MCEKGVKKEQLVDLMLTFDTEETISLFSTSLGMVEGTNTDVRCSNDWRETSGEIVEGITMIKPFGNDYWTN